MCCRCCCDKCRVEITVNAPNYVGSVADLEAALLRMARLKKVLRAADAAR